MFAFSDRDLPRVYTLTIDPETGFPCVKVSNNTLRDFATFQPRHIEGMKREFGLDELLLPFQGWPVERFGFGNGIERIGVTNDQTTYRFNLPKIRSYTSNPCDQCCGEKEISGRKCFHCRGTGKESIVSWIDARALSASISLLFQLLDLPVGETDDGVLGEKQLLTVNVLCISGQHGSELAGGLLPHFVDFLKLQGVDVLFDTATEAMRRAHGHMWSSPTGNDDFDMRATRAWQNTPGNLLLDVPGDACGVHPSPYVHTIPDGKGTPFTSHNVDSPLQQLTLLTGLAAMCDMYEKGK